MKTKEGATKIVNFMTLGTGVHVLGRGHISHIVKMHYCFEKNFFFTPDIDRTKCVYSNDDQGKVYQNCSFNDLAGQGFLP